MTAFENTPVVGVMGRKMKSCLAARDELKGRLRGRHDEVEVLIQHSSHLNGRLALVAAYTKSKGGPHLGVVGQEDHLLEVLLTQLLADFLGYSLQGAEGDHAFLLHVEQLESTLDLRIGISFRLNKVEDQHSLRRLLCVHPSTYQ